MFKALFTGVIAFDAEPGDAFLFPYPDQAEAVTGRERNLGTARSGVQLTRADVGVRGRRGEGGLPPRGQQFRAPVPGGRGKVDDAVGVAAVDINRMADI